MITKYQNSQNYHNFHKCNFYLLGSMDFLGWTIRWRPPCRPFSYYRRKNLELTTLKPNNQKRRKRNDANVQFYKQTKNDFKLWLYQCTSSNYNCTSIKSFPIIKSIYIQSSQNKKDPNDVTAALFSMFFFLLLAAEKKTPKTGQLWCH